MKLQLLKRNSFVLNTLNKIDEWLDENINKIYRRGGKVFLVNHYQNKENNKVIISNYNEEY